MARRRLELRSRSRGRHVIVLRDVAADARPLGARGAAGSARRPGGGRGAAQPTAGVPGEHRRAHPGRVRQAALSAVLALRHSRRLKGMMELGLLGDPRCTDALDLLESMRLADGWPAHAKFYRPSADIALYHDCADWGGTSTRRANQWVTADALTVLRAAGRLDLTWLPERGTARTRGHSVLPPGGAEWTGESAAYVRDNDNAKPLIRRGARGQRPAAPAALAWHAAACRRSPGPRRLPARRPPARPRRPSRLGSAG